MNCRVQEASVEWTDGKEVWHGWVAGIPEEKKKSRNPWESFRSLFDGTDADDEA